MYTEQSEYLNKKRRMASQLKAEGNPNVEWLPSFKAEGNRSQPPQATKEASLYSASEQQLDQTTERVPTAFVLSLSLCMD